jgi:hypothetical protein
MCITNDVMGGMNRATNQYIECDVENQAIDFDVAANYGANRKPGYDPALTPVSITDYGTAFSGYAVQMCHPYCYSGNLTIGVDFVPGSDAALRGETFFDFPTTGTNLTGLPITNAAGRASLGWIYLDGPALPAGAMVTAQMELKSTDKGILGEEGRAQDVGRVPLLPHRLDVQHGRPHPHHVDRLQAHDGDRRRGRVARRHLRRPLPAAHVALATPAAARPGPLPACGPGPSA